MPAYWCQRQCIKINRTWKQTSPCLSPPLPSQEITVTWGKVLQTDQGRMRQASQCNLGAQSALLGSSISLSWTEHCSLTSCLGFSTVQVHKARKMLFFLLEFVLQSLHWVYTAAAFTQQFHLFRQRKQAPIKKFSNSHMCKSFWGQYLCSSSNRTVSVFSFSVKTMPLY